MRGDFVAAAVIILVGAWLLALAFGAFDSSEAGKDDMEYDDYREVDPGSVLGVDGAVEVVSVGGKTFLHATGLGAASVTWEDGHSDGFTVRKAAAILVLMDGQSNAAYYNPVDPETAIAPEIGTGIYFGRPDGMPAGASEDVSDCDFYDFIGPDGSLRVGDKGPAWTKYYHDLSGKKTVWVSLGIGGRMISTWGPNGNAWAQNLKVMQAAMPLVPDGYSIERTIMLWAQGESDYNRDTGMQHYIDTWTARIHEAAPEAWGVDVDAFYLIDGRTKTCGWVNEAFQTLAEANEDVRRIAVGIADTFSVLNGMVYTDDIHYSQLGDNALATACAWQVAAIEGARPDGRAPIYLQESVVRCDVDADVVLDPVLCRMVDGTSTRLATEWESEPDTSAPGILQVSGSTAMPDMLLPGCPEPLATVYVGYVGFIGGFEYMRNADGLTVIGREPTLTDAIVPETAGGEDVTELGDYALQWGPWRNLSIPDTVTSIGTRCVQSVPLIRTAYIGDGLETVGYHAFSAITFMDGDAEVGVNAYTRDPSLIYGSWEWDGRTAGTLYRVES